MERGHHSQKAGFNFVQIFRRFCVPKSASVDSVEKSFWGDERNFLGPLMHFARGDVRGSHVSHKNDHRSSYRR